MVSRRDPNPLHGEGCSCCGCAGAYGPADIREAWQGVGDNWVGIAIVVALATFAGVVGCTGLTS